MYIPPTSSNVVHLFCKHPVLLVITIIAGISFTGALGCITCSPYAQCDNKSLVTFTFDDGYLSTYNIAYPILDKYDYKATAFIPTDVIGQDNYMTEHQIEVLSAYGWEIGSHAKSHKKLTDLSESEVLSELKDSKEILNGITLSSIPGFASPQDAYNDEIINDISSMYTYHRTCAPGYNDIPPTDIYQLKSMVITETTTVEQVKGWIDYAYANNKWLILTFHDLNGSGMYSWPSQNLEEVAKYLHDKDYTSSPSPT